MMEETKKENGGLNEEAETKDEGQETQLDEDAKEVLKSLKWKQRLLKWLERTWIVVVVCIALTIVGWMACGRWLQAFNNALWLFIAWMYWKQREAFSNAADYTVYLTEMLADSNEMVECYEKKDAIMEKSFKEMEERYQKLIEAYEKKTALLEGIIADYEKEDDDE